jgi:hypothetical protein
METLAKRSLITQDTSSVDILNRPIIGNGLGPLWVDGVNMNPDSWYWEQNGYGIKSALEGIDYYSKKQVYNTNNELVGEVGPDKMVTIAGAPQWMTTSTKVLNVANLDASSASTNSAKIWMTCNPTMFTPNPDVTFPAFTYYQQYWEVFSNAVSQLPPGVHNACTNVFAQFGNQAFYQQNVIVTTATGSYEVSGYKDPIADEPSVRQCQMNRGWVPFIPHSTWPSVFPGAYTQDSAKYTANPYRCSWNSTNAKIDSWHVADFAYMAQKVAERYGGDYYRIFNNMEAYRDQTTGVYDSQAFTGMWNAVYSGIKQVKPNAKIAGPGLLIRWYSDPNQTENAETLASCKGSWGVFDKRSTDAIRYWLSNKAGGSSIEVVLQPTDASGGNDIVAKSNDPAYREFQVKERIAAVKACVDAVQREVSPQATALLPVSIGNLQGTANYGSANLTTARQNAIYANTLGEIVNNGFDYVMFPDIAYIGVQNNGIYNMLKGVRDTFGGDGYGFEKQGTILYSPTFDEQKIGVFAGAKGMMLVNKQSTAEPTSVNGCAPINLGAYEVKFNVLLDCNAPNTPPNFAAQVDGKNVNLTWGESTDVESLIAGYRVYRSGTNTPIASLGADARSFTDVYGGSSDATFSYYVTSVDAFGNESARATQNNVVIDVDNPETLADVNVTCTVVYETGNSCSVTLPEYCQTGLSVQPTHGTSVVANSKITYTSNNTSTTEENYAHIRQKDAQTAKCNVNIKFVAVQNPSDPLADVSISCTVAVNEKTCSVTAPEYCTATLNTQPTHGTSTLENSKVTYTSNGTSRTEENYIHKRVKAAETAKCSVNIKFANSGNSGGTTGGSSTGTNVKLPGNPKTGSGGFAALKVVIPVGLLLSLISGFAIYKKRLNSGTR